MNEKELKELERLAKAAIEHNPEESEDLLEQAILERKDDMWQIIQKKAHRRVRMRKIRPWIAAAAVVMMAVIISGAIGVSQARAGKEGLLVDIVEGVAGKVAFSDNPMDQTDFLPVTLEDGTWDDVMANMDPVMIPLLPKGLPEEYVFDRGSIYQPSPTNIKINFSYINSDTSEIKTVYYTYEGEDSVTLIEPGTEKYSLLQWDKTTVHFMINGEMINIAWEQDACLIEVMGLNSEEEGRMWFDAIRKEP